MPSLEDREFVANFLSHTPLGDLGYNPIQAHEYYLRNRALKGRQPAAQKPSLKGRPTSRSKDSIVRSKSGAINPSIIPKRVSPQLLSKMRQDAANTRVAGLQKRLSSLNEALKTLLAKAKEKTKDGKSDGPVKKEAQGGSDKRPELNAKQKREAAVRSKDFYEKNKDLKNKDPSEMNLKEVKDQIGKIRVQLKDAIAKARQQSSKQQTVKGR